MSDGQPERPMPASTDARGWARCPGCGYRFKPHDAVAFSDGRHVRCGKLLRIDGAAPPMRPPAPTPTPPPAGGSAAARPDRSSVAHTEPFSEGFIAGVVTTLVVGLGGGTVLAIATRSVDLVDIWSIGGLLRIGLAGVVVGLVFGLIFVTPTRGTDGRSTAPRDGADASDPTPDELARVRLMASRSPDASRPTFPDVPGAGAALGRAPASSGAETLSMLDTEFGRYLKAVFDHLRDKHPHASFTYEDLPAPPESLVAPDRTADRPDWLPDDAEHHRTGSAVDWVKSDVLKTLKDRGAIRSVDIRTFELTPLGLRLSVEIGVGGPQ